MAPLRELAVLARDGDVDGIRQCLQRLDPPLQLGPRASRSDMDFVVAVRLALRRQHEARVEGKAQDQRRISDEAAIDLVKTVRRTRGVLHLDLGLLLGPLLADQRRKHVTFVVETKQVSVRRAVLARARRVLRPMSDLSATVDPAGLYLRWHGGRGGLNLRHQQLSAAEIRESLMVVFPARARKRPERAADGHTEAFSPPAVPSPRLAPERAPERPSGAWLAEVLAELGFGL
jgi:hypothetical protein